MHFREKGKCLQLLRTIYDPKLKRGVQSMVGKLPLDAVEVPTCIQELLSQQEMQQLTDYIAVMSAVHVQKKQAACLDSIESTLAYATAALSTATHTQNEERAAKIWAELDAFSAALRKAGYTKPAKTKKEKPQN